MSVPLGVVEAGRAAADHAAAQAAAANRIAAHATPRPFHCYYCAANAKAAAAGCSACVCTTGDVEEGSCTWGGCPARVEMGRASFSDSMRAHYGMPVFERIIE